MTKLSATQAVILSAASQRDDGAVLPLPETFKIKGGAVDKVLGSLKAKGLIDHQGAPRGDELLRWARFCASLRCSNRITGTSASSSLRAASSRPWPARMPAFSSTRIGFVQRNSTIDAAI
jgi:hypothetical protein